jgi:steroid delta-isomerase
MPSRREGAPVSDPDAIRTTIDAYVAHMSHGDREQWLGLFADGATVEDPVGTPRHEGREAIGGFFDLVQGLADRVTLEVTGPVQSPSPRELQTT